MQGRKGWAKGSLLVFYDNAHHCASGMTAARWLYWPFIHSETASIPMCKSQMDFWSIMWPKQADNIHPQHVFLYTFLSRFFDSEMKVVSIPDKIKLICVILYIELGSFLITKEQRKMICLYIFKMVNIMLLIK